MTALPIEAQRDLYEAFDPSRPLAAGDKWYIEFTREDQGRGRKPPVVRQLWRQLGMLRPDAAHHLLFTGFPGSGKSTELLQLQAQLAEKDDTHCVLIDAEDFVNKHLPLQSSDVLRVLAYSLDKAAWQAEGKKGEPKDGYLKRFMSFLGTEIDFKSLQMGIGDAKLMGELRISRRFRDQVANAMRARFQTFVSMSHQAIRKASDRLREALNVKRVVVIFDSLEKIRAANPTGDDEIESSLRRVFYDNAELLRVPGCQVIYTFPIYLHFQQPDLATRYSNEPVVLPMVKINDRDRGPFEPGIARLIELVEARIGEHKPGFLGEPEVAQHHLRRLVCASGGYLKDLLRLCRNTLSEAEVFPITDDDVDLVLQEFEEAYQRAFRTDHLPALVHVGQTFDLPETPAQHALASALIQRFFVLAYSNGSAWYDLHPMVRSHPTVAAALSPPSSSPA